MGEESGTFIRHDINELTERMAKAEAGLVYTGRSLDEKFEALDGRLARMEVTMEKMSRDIDDLGRKFGEHVIREDGDVKKVESELQGRISVVADWQNDHHVRHMDDERRLWKVIGMLVALIAAASTIVAAWIH